MNREELLDALRHGSLDRDTKLMIIDLLVLSDDPKLEEEIGQLVSDWHQADQAIVAALLHRFDEIANKYNEQENSAQSKIRKETLSLADDVSREQEIKKVRDIIETL